MVREKVLNIYKPEGVSPKQVVDQLREEEQLYADSKIAYAGRLDPMASGVLLLLIDDECKNRDAYQDLSKAYSFDAIIGVRTDTYDILGVILESTKLETNKTDIQKIVSSYYGKFIQEYPPYSSFHVDGKPLFWWAKENRLDEIAIPSKEVTINNLKLIGEATISKEEILSKLDMAYKNLEGEFRKNEILELWNKLDINEFKTFSFEADVGSGTYIRSIVNSIGIELELGATALNIERTMVGSFKLSESRRLLW
jgi:tRNA pseudouridine55 synthase